MYNSLATTLPRLGTLAPRRLERIGIQLYTVRRVLPGDFEGTLAKLGAMGYREVEFAGYFNHSAADVKAILVKAGLTSPSSHMDFVGLRKDPAPQIDFAAAVGHEFVTVAWVDESLRKTKADWLKIADDFNRIGAAVKARGMRFAYHNHDMEFKPVDGEMPLDLLMAHTDPSLVNFQLDLYWITEGGQSPFDYIKRYPTRFVMFHMKDSAGPPKHEQVDVGSGKIDFSSILRLDAEQKHVVRHVFVEHDDPADPMTFARNSVDYLKKLEY